MRESVLKSLLRSIVSSVDGEEPCSRGPGQRLLDLGRDWLNENLLSIMNFYPPYLGAGIRVEDYDRDFRTIRVKMDLHWWNQNYVGTQFGGSLYSMCDPFYMLMLMRNLGSGYEVWDKSASIRFRKPGRGTVFARFELDEGDLVEIRQAVADEGVSEPVFTVDVKDEEGETITEIEKELHVTAS